jgi:hypothetical protein
MKRIGILILALGIASCEMGDRENKRALVTLLGMGAGGVLGYYGVVGDFTDKFIASSLMGAGGAAVGYYLSDRLLPHDREKLDSTAFKALDEAAQGQSIVWGEKVRGEPLCLSATIPATMVRIAAPTSPRLTSKTKRRE